MTTTLLTPNGVTLDANAAGAFTDAYDVSRHTGAALVVMPAGTSTPSSAVIELQRSDDKSNWYDTSTATTVTGTGKSATVDIRSDMFVRARVKTAEGSAGDARVLILADDFDPMSTGGGGSSTAYVVRDTSAPADTDALWYDTSTDRLFAYDATRAHWLSVYQTTIDFYKNGTLTAGTFLEQGDNITPNANRGNVQGRARVVVGVEFNVDGAFSGDVLIQVDIY